MNSIHIVADRSVMEFVLGSALCALACGTALSVWLWLRFNGETGAWPGIEGIILERSVAIEHDADGQIYRPVVRYKYELDGKLYQGSCIDWSMVAHRKYTSARQKLDKYDPGRMAKVHYDPANPTMSVLQPGPSIVIFPTPVIAATSIVYVMLIAGPVLFKF
jgi:hypothetical protein